MKFLPTADPEVYALLQKELARQKNGLLMIPSENYTSPAALEAQGSVLTNKYAEGYPGKRYYTGCQFIDAIEQLAIDRAKKLFNAEHANVQPHSGSSANMAAYLAILKPGDKILALDLTHGGHLTHGNPVNFSGKLFNFVHYRVRRDTEMLDMDEIRALALAERPKLIVSGQTCYPRALDFDKFAAIATEIQAYSLADISHIVGLCLAGVHQNPVASHDIVTTTTHKTLRGTRSAIILSKIADRYHDLYHPEEKKNLAQLIDAAVFPGLQGGPLEHIIASKAVSFAEDLKPEFKTYQQQIYKNAQALAATLLEQDLRLVSGGTDNHLMLIDCTPLGITGRQGANRLAECEIYTNCNTIPYEPRTPFDPSGIRLGTPALTSRGMKEAEMKIIGELIAKVLKNITSDDVRDEAILKVKELTEQYPIYSELEY